ncbi:uncharacterized protein A4U43_C01F23930 [Asparagus officinalis]|uniref:Uncharacterized protein n=1 Tax=Asparagus officinalis TaxID=4686 RepID=A0A5P1FVW3_ASPOF|nr:uncharacterized protein A4U43_C01F23930 [Asparagus officinalis]
MHDLNGVVSKPDEFTSVLVPCLPRGGITVCRAQTPIWFDEPGYEDFLDSMTRSEEAADGVVVNTFEELEPEYLESYERAIGKRFLNEKFVVEILKIGVSLGVKEPSPVTGKGIMRVTRDQIQSAVRSLMDAGKEGEERRAKARECGEMARKAMEEGGSSYGNVTRLIQFATGNAKR